VLSATNTRDPATGEKRIFGEYLTCSQGEDVVAGIATPLPFDAMSEAMPDVYKELVSMAARIEAHYEDVQDIEFTVERRKAYILQTREAKRSARASPSFFPRSTTSTSVPRCPPRGSTESSTGNCAEATAQRVAASASRRSGPPFTLHLPPRCHAGRAPL